METGWQPHSLAGETPFRWSLQAFARPQIQIAHPKSLTSDRAVVGAGTNTRPQDRAAGLDSQHCRLVGRSFPQCGLTRDAFASWAEHAAARIPQKGEPEQMRQSKWKRTVRKSNSNPRKRQEKRMGRRTLEPVKVIRLNLHELEVHPRPRKV